jgi:hypothetical protein
VRRRERGGKKREKGTYQVNDSRGSNRFEVLHKRTGVPSVRCRGVDTLGGVVVEFLRRANPLISTTPAQQEANEKVEKQTHLEISIHHDLLLIRILERLAPLDRPR